MGYWKVVGCRITKEIVKGNGEKMWKRSLPRVLAGPRVATPAQQPSRPPCFPVHTAPETSFKKSLPTIAHQLRINQIKRQTVAWCPSQSNEMNRTLITVEQNAAKSTVMRRKSPSDSDETVEMPWRDHQAPLRRPPMACLPRFCDRFGPTNSITFQLIYCAKSTQMLLSCLKSTCVIKPSVINVTYLFLFDWKRAMTMCLNSAGEMLPAHLSVGAGVWRQRRPMALTARPRPTVFSPFLFSFPLFSRLKFVSWWFPPEKLLLTSVSLGPASLRLFLISLSILLTVFFLSFLFFYIYFISFELIFSISLEKFSFRNLY